MIEDSELTRKKTGMKFLAKYFHKYFLNEMIKGRCFPSKSYRDKVVWRKCGAEISGPLNFISLTNLPPHSPVTTSEVTLQAISSERLSGGL